MACAAYILSPTLCAIFFSLIFFELWCWVFRVVGLVGLAVL